jgi:hypothetical protein
MTNLEKPIYGLISRPLIQIAQLECQFKGPLLVDDQVELLEDLANGQVNLKYVYEHKRVWVKEFKCFYYLEEGDGTNINNWKRVKARLMLEPYDETAFYQQGDACHFFGKIYIASIDVKPGFDPIRYPNVWDVVTGEIETYRYAFKDLGKPKIDPDTEEKYLSPASIIVYTEIRNPRFEIKLGDVVIDPLTGSEVVDPVSGLLLFENTEIVDVIAYPLVITRNDDDDPPEPPYPRGIPYQLDFYIDEVIYTIPIEEDGDQVRGLSGYINIK